MSILKYPNGRAKGLRARVVFLPSQPVLSVKTNCFLDNYKSSELATGVCLLVLLYYVDLNLYKTDTCDPNPDSLSLFHSFSNFLAWIGIWIRTFFDGSGSAPDKNMQIRGDPDPKHWKIWRVLLRRYPQGSRLCRPE